jgi:hypothetical protein
MVSESIETILRTKDDEPVIPRITPNEVKRLLALPPGVGGRPSHAGIPETLGDGRFVRPPGRLVTPGELGNLREGVLSDLASAGFEPGSRITGPGKAKWDRTLGASLLDRLPISAVQASERDVWAYLTLFVFWEFAAWRYPGTKSTATATDGDEPVEPIKRVFGEPRNVLRKCWIRADILGPDLGVDGAVPGAEHLGEDELVNLFERSTLGDNRDLARAVARAIYRNRPKSLKRMEFTREFTKQLLRRTVSTHYSYRGPAMDDLLDEIALSIGK